MPFQLWLRCITPSGVAWVQHKYKDVILLVLSSAVLSVRYGQLHRVWSYCEFPSTSFSMRCPPLFGAHFSVAQFSVAHISSCRFFQGKIDVPFFLCQIFWCPILRLPFFRCPIFHCLYYHCHYFHKSLPGILSLLFYKIFNQNFVFLTEGHHCLRTEWRINCVMSVTSF